MGSKGSKPRKPNHSQHLPKVGSATEDQRSQHAEREAVLDNMGMRGASQSTRMIVGIIVVIVIVVALLALLGFNTFH
jgi:hypothetical protein